MVKMIRTAIKVGIFLFIASFLMNCTVANVKNEELVNVQYEGFIQNKTFKYPGIIRLHNEERQFFCTGVVIDNNYALTAAHCVNKNLEGGAPRLSSDDILIFDQRGDFTKVIARAGAMNTRLDYAVIRGDFKDFEKYPISSSEAPELYSNNFIYISCGYPMGQKALLCVKLQPIGNEYFAVKAKSEKGLYPGMSGGPVFYNNTVIGVNSHVGDDFVAFSPLIGYLS